MAWLNTQDIVVLLLVFGVGLIVGRLSGNQRRSEGARGVHVQVDRDLDLTRGELAPVGRQVYTAAPESGLEVQLAAETADLAWIRRDLNASRPRIIHLAAPDDIDEFDLVADMREPTRPDDLTLVDGIGPKIAAALNDAGIDTFRGLALSSEATLQEALEAAGFRFALFLPRWPRDAARLALAAAEEEP